MDRYIDNRNPELKDVNEVTMDDLLWCLVPCSACTRNPMRRKENCYLTCRYKELWSTLLDKYIKNK